MKKLIILNINGYLYTLLAGNMEYNINIEFYDLENSVKENDALIVSDEILNTMLKYKIISFGSIDSKYGKAQDELNETDVIILKSGEKTIYLKQVFG